MNKLFLCASEEVQSTHKDLLQEIRNEGFNLTPYNQQEYSKIKRLCHKFFILRVVQEMIIQDYLKIENPR